MQAETACAPDQGVALQVLGSGGPIADDGRASAGYLLWIDGRSRLLIDAGGGVFLRFAEAGARFGDLDVIALSHLHTDHSAALPALLKSGSFSGRTRPLVLAGPGAGGPFPGVRAFAAALLGSGDGAYGYLSAYLSGKGRLPVLDIQSFSPRVADRVRNVMLPDADVYSLETLPVPHGIVPSLAYRVRVGSQTLVFGSDQNGSSPEFVEFAKGADLLVMHMAIPGDADSVAKRLHATPQRIGEIAGEAKPDTLVLSHFMRRSLRGLDDNLAAVREGFAGQVELADDLDCFALPARK
ncbi:MAG: MBL fold metallo-hydrolase [Pseudomonadota bacterium]